MTASERVAALRRARQRQARIEAATAQAIRAHWALERAIIAKQVAAERHDERVAKAEVVSASETAELARVCGSPEAAAEIVGWSIRDVRRVLKTENERRAESSGKKASPARRGHDDVPQVSRRGGPDDDGA
ncbi:MAG TPA: hypothetical protein VFG33_19465 [Kribbella sp.]|uniref:hypothetical protein n=1 Tax=Kribbella sp. TaxID=1871183 RepID=UPI002D7A2464|nr:hypothetical protein [Kribbella sp.]HET6295576.1 hypothetical protein [Kribbella sp.]